MTVLGKRLKEARENNRLTQMEASKKLGISNGTLSGYERNYRDPDTAILEKMAELYGVSVDYLLGRTDDPNPQLKNNSSAQLTAKDEKDIAKRLEQIRNDIEHSDGLSFSGEPMSEEAKDSLMEAMEFIVRQTKKINKKYIPKKYRKDDH